MRSLGKSLFLIVGMLIITNANTVETTADERISSDFSFFTGLGIGGGQHHNARTLLSIECLEDGQLLSVRMTRAVNTTSARPRCGLIQAYNGTTRTLTGTFDTRDCDSLGYEAECEKMGSVVMLPSLFIECSVVSTIARFVVEKINYNFVELTRCFPLSCPSDGTGFTEEDMVQFTEAFLMSSDEILEGECTIAGKAQEPLDGSGAELHRESSGGRLLASSVPLVLAWVISVPWRA